MGQAVRHEWDARDRLSKKILARTVSGGSSEHPEIRYTYETWGPLHDARHFAKSSDTTPMKTITYLRNRAGDVTAVSDDSIQATPLYGYTVDKLGRTTQATAKYLPGGDRPIDYAFDARGDLLTLTLTDPNEVLVHAYTYAADSGKIATATFPGSAMPIAITRWPHDGEKVVTYPGGVTREVDYDVRGPVSEIRIKPAAGTPLIEKWAYTYTDVLSVATMTDSASRVTTYGYDSLDRLTSADHPTLPPPLDTLPSLETFTYDGVGNRTMSGYAHDANHRMRTSPGHSYDYDDDGNTKVRDPGTSGQASYTWDLDNRLTAYASGATSVAYTQDPFARRLKKTVGSTTTWYLWSGDRLLAAYSGTGTRTARYTPLGGFAPAQMALPNGGSELIYDVHSDRLDTPRVMTSSGGSVVWQAAYEAYGQAHVSTAISTPLNVRLPGQYLDAESSLHDNYFRTYDPAMGRYISADPIGQAGGLNVYRYARNNPLNWTDPFGLYVDIVINRTGTTPNSVTGTYTATSSVTGTSVSGHTLENPNPPNPNLPAPPGSYSAHVDSRPGRPDRVELNNVPNASDVQLHVGNTAKDVVGCFAVGNTAGNGFVGDSANAMNALNNLIAADGSGDIIVTIVGSGNSSQSSYSSSPPPPNMSYAP